MSDRQSFFGNLFSGQFDDCLAFLILLLLDIFLLHGGPNLHMAREVQISYTTNLLHFLTNLTVDSPMSSIGSSSASLCFIDLNMIEHQFFDIKSLDL